MSELTFRQLRRRAKATITTVEFQLWLLRRQPHETYEQWHERDRKHWGKP